MEGRVDAVVLGAGSGGTFTGTTRFLKEKNPKLIAVCVQPVGSVYCGAPLVEWKVEGIGNGFIDVFDPSTGVLLQRLVNRGHLNSPWGMTAYNGTLVVANSGDGRILRYDLCGGGFLGPLKDCRGNPLVIDGIAGLARLQSCKCNRCCSPCDPDRHRLRCRTPVTVG